MHAHLLAAVALATRQDPNRLDFETHTFCEIRQYKINWNMSTLITDVVVDHYKRRAWLEHSAALEYHQGQFLEVVANHSWNTIIVQDFFFAAVLKILGYPRKDFLGIHGTHDCFPRLGIDVVA